VLLAGALGACERVVPAGDDGPRVLELAHDTIRLEAGVRLVEVAVRREAGGEFHPVRVEARVGDVIRFTADDNAGHAIAFVGAALQPDVRAFLQTRAQLRSPPLIAKGAAWVLTLDGAPPGDYPFHCSTHNTAGRLTVVAR
jgi:plastocyanin